MKIKTHKPISINGLSGYTIKCASDVESYTFYGSVTLGAGFSIIADTSPTNGMNVSFWFRTAITPGGYAFNILGTTINPTLVAGYFVAFAEYFDGAWTVWCAGIPQVSITLGGIGSITKNANGDLIIAPLGIVNSMINASAAIDYSKLAALTASKILGSNGSGVISALDTATYPSLTELALVKGATGSPLQTQIAAVISSLSAYALSSDVASAIATALTAYYTSTQVDSLLAAVQLNAQTYNVPLTANTTLTAATITNIVAFDSTGGGFTVYLPLISSLPDGYVVTLKQYGSNAVVFGANVSDGGFTEVTGLAALTISLSSSGGVTKVQAHRATKLWVVI